MTLPEGRKPLLWSDMEFAKPVKANQFNCLSGHPSTWEGEAKALREQNTELALQVLASDGQAAEAHEARLIAEDQAKALRRDYALMKTDRNNLRSLLDQAEANVDELHDKLETAEDQTKALQARVAKLEAAVMDYRHVLHSAKAGRDLHCGMYVAKEYHFTRDQIDAALANISAALQEDTQ